MTRQRSELLSTAELPEDAKSTALAIVRQREKADEAARLILAKRSADCDRIESKNTEATAVLIESAASPEDVHSLLGDSEMPTDDSVSVERRRKASKIRAAYPEARRIAAQGRDEAADNVRGEGGKLATARFDLSEVLKKEEAAVVVAVLADLVRPVARLLALDALQAELIRGRAVVARDGQLPRIWSGSALVRRLIDGMAPAFKPAAFEDAALAASVDAELAEFRTIIKGN